VWTTACSHLEALARKEKRHAGHTVAPPPPTLHPPLCSIPFETTDFGGVTKTRPRSACLGFSRSLHVSLAVAPLALCSLSSSACESFLQRLKQKNGTLNLNRTASGRLELQSVLSRRFPPPWHTLVEVENN